MISTARSAARRVLRASARKSWPCGVRRVRPEVRLRERASDFAFEIGDLLADGGLGDMELAAGFAEGAMVGNGAEVA